MAEFYFMELHQHAAGGWISCSACNICSLIQGDPSKGRSGERDGEVNTESPGTRDRETLLKVLLRHSTHIINLMRRTPDKD